MDSSLYLPSARQVQRKFGGVRVLRAELGYSTTDFGSGTERSKLATTHNARSLTSERELERVLADKFGELFVHSEKLYGKGKNRVDFLVYTKTANFGIDVFTTETKRDLQKNVNLKVDKYLDFPEHVPLFFAVASMNLTDEDVTNSIKNMSKISRIPLLKVVSISQLVVEVENLTPLIPPVGFTAVTTSKA